MTSIETGIHEAIDFTADTATDAFAASGVNKISNLKLEDRCDQLEIEILKEKKENNGLRERVLARECYSRRDNLLFHGFPEDKNEKSDDCKNKVRLTLTDMDISESDIRIVICHRKGAKRKNTNRPIIVRFHWFGDIKLIMSKNADLRKKSKNMNKFATQDWPEEIEKRRRMLLPVLHRAKAAKYNARLIMLIIDKLIVNNNTYTLDNLHELPEAINPKKFSTVENNDIHVWCCSGESMCPYLLFTYITLRWTRCSMKRPCCSRTEN